MARTQDPDSADSQFYIALTTLPHLDGKYTVFGQVVKGLDVIDKVQKDDVIVSMVFKRK
jgi:cyclophilin family peptidyl-prolyl cis-trans isomerase